MVKFLIFFFMFDGVPARTVRICKDIYNGTKLPEVRNKNKGKVKDGIQKPC